MKNVNVKVEMNANGEVVVTGLKANGQASAVNYSVVEMVGVKEYIKECVKIETIVQAELLKAGASEPKASEHKADTKPAADKKPTQQNKKGYDSIGTRGTVFTNIKGFKHEGIFHAVKFNIAGKGDCVVGFAKDRNAFMEHFNGVSKEVLRSDVVKRMAKYQGKDAAQLTKMIQQLKPVTMAAGHCVACGCEVSRSVKEYSVRKYNEILCRNCQGNHTPDTDNTKKGAERSEAQNPQADTCACGNELKAGWANCSECYEQDLAKSRLVVNEHTCACGSEKERAQELCDTCSANTWSATDENQLTTETIEEGSAIDILEDELPEFYFGYDDKCDEEVAVDYSELFDPSELTVNAGVKGIANSVTDESVE